jgi:ribonuclease HII
MFSYEDATKGEGYNFIIGVDEAGRGPLAGPVVASAVAIKNKKFQNPIKDSKILTVNQREKAFAEIYQNAYVGIGIINEAVIDRINILQATFLAMSDAVTQLISELPISQKEHKNFNQKIILLIDGDRFKSHLPYAYKTIVRGDALIPSISCASIIAKVKRDKIMESYDQTFPQYGFKQHKGYPTVKHKQALQRYGPSLIHRKSFKY